MLGSLLYTIVIIGIVERCHQMLDAQKTHHLSTIIDTERPYTFYLNREKE